MPENKLITETKRYETNINTLKKIKNMFKNGNYSYFAGTLLVSVPDLIKKEPYVSVDIKPLSEIIDKIEQEIVYYASRMYAKHRSSSCSFYSQAVANIKEYEK